MSILYNFGIRLYYVIILIASIFKVKARLWIKGRHRWEQKLRTAHDPRLPTVWFHASSLGEFEQGRPLMEAFRKRKPEYKIILSFFSSSGYEIRKNYSGADFICYLPLDTPYNARRFLQLVNPEYIVFIKYEFWYNFLKEAYKSSAKLILVSSIFRAGQVFFKPYGGWYRKMLYFFDQIFVQDPGSFNMLQNIGYIDASIAGDTRFDRVVEIAADSLPIPLVERFTDGYFTIVCGSTWSKDEEILCKYINQSPSGIRYIIAPHEISELHISNLQKMIDKRIVRFSKAGDDDFSRSKVLVIDNIGMLSSLYKYGKVAYIGGGFGVGIHNILEAAVYGKPVVFGPNFQKFREAVELIDREGAFSISGYHDLKARFDMLRDDPKLLQHASAAAKEYVELNTGATGVILKYLIQN
jgi:3-deoxy-D-manno-octulosonic-acid transferase